MLVDIFTQSIQNVENVSITDFPAKKSSEDFAWFTNVCPSILFRYGSRNEEKGCIYTAHRPDFKLDEDSFKYPILSFVNFVLNYHK